MTNDVKALIEAVAAGMHPTIEMIVRTPLTWRGPLIFASLKGSFDGARMLHDAELPEWDCHLSLGRETTPIRPAGNSACTEGGDAYIQDNPARARLLAILRTHAQEAGL